MSEEQPKEYLDKKPGFVIKSGIKDAAGDEVDFSIITDAGQGFEYRVNGVKLDHCNAQSYEECGKDVQAGTPAKIIRATRGNIVIEALDGDIILRANNIRIQAKDGSGEVTINSTKQIALNSPIVNAKSSNLNLLASNSASIAAQATDTVGNIQNTQAASVDVGQASILGKLLGVLTKFKKFLLE
jgi:hypothetical protein